MNRIAHALRGRLAGRLADRECPDDGAALLLTLFLMLLVTAMSITIASAVLVQVRPTLVTQKTTRTVSGAEAGIEVALNRIRASNGTLSSVPCTGSSSTTFTGTVGSATGSQAYSVVVRYYTVNPSTLTTTQRSSSSYVITCSSGAPSSQPYYALLEATGSGASISGTASGTGNRTVEVTYEFTTDNTNVLGGLIYDFSSATGYCLAAQSMTSGANVVISSCDSTALAQDWSYTTDLFLQVKTSSGTKYCLSASSVSNAEATLASCNASDYKQIWSFNDVGRFEGTSNGSSTNGYCLSVKNDNTNSSKIIVGSCSGGSTTSTAYYSNGGTYNSKWTFSPTAAVGAGKAGDTTYQLVNYKYFGRCLDITGQSPSATYLIGYPCKMAPSTSNITWNQKFYWDSTNGMLCTDTSSSSFPSSTCPKSGSTTRYCLKAGTSGTTPTTGTRALLALCSTSDTSQKWSRNYDTGAYGTSYTILTQSGGLCLDLNPTGASEASTYDKQWGVVQVSTCDGTTRQKWNAPANLTDSNTSNFYEHTS